MSGQHAKNNPELSSARYKRHAQKESRKIKLNLWKEKNREKISAYTKKWQAANKEKQRELERRRRARQAGAEGTHTKEDVNEIFTKQRGLCAICRIKIKKFHIDHIIPLSSGGTSWKDNIQILCPRCNMQKGKKHPIDFMQSKGYLL